MERLFKSKLLNCLFLGGEISFHEYEADLLMKIEYPSISNLNQYSLKEMIQIVRDSPHFGLFVDAMNLLNDDLLYKSQIHGISHIERTSLNAFFLSLLENINDYEMKLCLECAKYHDIGRLSDGEDLFHGIIGSKKYLKYITDKSFDVQETDIIAFVIACHCLNESNSLKILNCFFEVPEKFHKLCKKLLFIVKDADALDRFRLSAHSLNTNFLNIQTSLRMIKASYELYIFSKNNEEN